MVVWYISLLSGHAPFFTSTISSLLCLPSLERVFVQKPLKQSCVGEKCHVTESLSSYFGYCLWNNLSPCCAVSFSLSSSRPPWIDSTLGYLCHLCTDKLLVNGSGCRHRQKPQAIFWSRSHQSRKSQLSSCADTIIQSKICRYTDFFQSQCL